MVYHPKRRRSYFLKMKIDEKIKDHEERLKKLEEEVFKKDKPLIESTNSEYIFKNKNEPHNKLLKNLLGSDYCHKKGGLTREEIFNIFNSNNRPVVPKKINDLLTAWKKRKKIEAIKINKKLKFFWIKNDKPKKGN